jgi:hypothetical protein
MDEHVFCLSCRNPFHGVTLVMSTGLSQAGFSVSDNMNGFLALVQHADGSIITYKR